MPSLRPLQILLPVGLLAACGGTPVTDPNNRDIPWNYAPTNSMATAEHMRGTGKEGPGPIAKGWHCKLVGGKQLTILPYQLAPKHALFGKVVMTVGLFDKSGKELASFVSPVITDRNASFTFDVPEPAVAQLWDLILWFRKA